MGEGGKEVVVSYIADPKLDVKYNFSDFSELTKFSQFCLKIGVLTEEELKTEEAINIAEKRFEELEGQLIECAIVKNDKGFYKLDIDSLKRLESAA